MECPIQKFLSKKSVIRKSNCIIEIENFKNYQFNESISSATVHFFEFDSEWKTEIVPEYYSDTYFKFKIILNPAIVCQLENLLCQVSGTAASVKIFESGFLKVVKGEMLFSCAVARQSVSDLLSTDGLLTVTLQVELQYMIDAISFQKRHSSANTKLQLEHQYSTLLNDSTHSDFTFIVKGKSFKVHKNILASVSDTMRAMFANDYKETIKGECHLNDIEPNVFEDMLRFIYSGILPANLEDVSMDLYRVADYYRIVGLMEICKEDIHFRLSSRNALDVYTLATMCDIEDLRMDAWKIVKWQCLKIFFPLNNEPLPLEDFQEIRDIRFKEMEFWSKHKKVSVAEPVT